MRLPTVIAICAFLCTAVRLHTAMADEHVKALKEFVAEHPHLHELVDKTHAGDLDAKHKFEREALSVRCKF